ncbi:MAG: putative endonuclease containing URI domain [Gammaproteobacteria bacterium]|nr:putative endonuclease containing URI domain [Gammaproteobacteria bacterium]
MPEWVTYMLRCADNSLYTGITTDLERRLHEHNYKHNGAAYTRSRRPVTLVYQESFQNRADAARREYVIRTLPKAVKEKLLE